ncbi:MAG: molybdopterin molybdotransferase MoeA [Coriobacteriia bacterium]|nr:molybdopterin molybdotransferase MoeA [Coriobacteriia bacterium]
MTHTSLSFDRALKRWLSTIERLDPETVLLDESLGRILAADLSSDIDVSPFDNSAMDGFALRARDIAKASPATPIDLEVVTCIAAGDYWEGTLQARQAARIMTGAPLPAGADIVVKVEDTTKADSDQHVRFSSAASRGLNIRLRGEEIKAGERVLASGEYLGPAAVGLLAATGYVQVPVFRQPTVAIISTGEELIPVGDTPTRGKIRNSNSHSLAAQAQAAGARVRQYASIPDTLEDTVATFRQASTECDIIISSGGVSVGDFDFVEEAVQSLGDLHFSTVKMRPGKPQVTGMINKLPFFGLPGNPTSAYLGFELFVRPAILKMAGHTRLQRPVQTAVLSHDIKKRQGLRYFMRGRVRLADIQEPAEPSSSANAQDRAHSHLVQVTGNQSSALLGSLHEANCLLVLPEEETELKAGTVVKCIRLDMEERVEL